MMRVSLSGLLSNAADALDNRRDDGGYAFMLREAAKHARETKEGKHTVEEFAEFYCLTDPQSSLEPDFEPAEPEVEIESINGVVRTVPKSQAPEF